MAFVNIKIAGPSLAVDQVRRLQAGVTTLLADCLRSGLSGSQSLRIAETGITVNAVAPGPVEAALSEHARRQSG